MGAALNKVKQGWTQEQMESEMMNFLCDGQ